MRWAAKGRWWHQTLDDEQFNMDIWKPTYPTPKSGFKKHAAALMLHMEQIACGEIRCVAHQEADAACTWTKMMHVVVQTGSQVGDKTISNEKENIWALDRFSLRYKITSKPIWSSSWSSIPPLQMLIISSLLLLAISFFAQVAVLAAPIPLNARAPLLYDDALFSRADTQPRTFAWMISWHFDLTDHFNYPTTCSKTWSPTTRWSIIFSMSAWSIADHFNSTCRPSQTTRWSIIFSESIWSMTDHFTGVPKPEFGMFVWTTSWHFDSSLECFESWRFTSI